MKKNNKKFSWMDLFRAVLYLVGENKKKYLFWNFVRFITYFNIVISPFILGKVVDFFTKYQRGDSLMLFCQYVAVLIFSNLVLLLLRSFSKQQLIYVRNATYRKLRTRGFQYLSEQSLQNSQKGSIGSKVQKIENGKAALKVVVSTMENRIFETMALLIGTIGIFVFAEPFYALFFAGYYFLFFIILKSYYKIIQHYNYQRNIALEGASGIFVEGLNNILSLKVFSAENSFKKLLDKKEKITEEIGNREIETVLNQWRWFHALNSISTGAFLLVVGVGVVKGSITVGLIVVLFTYFEKLVNSAHYIIGLYQDFIGAKNGIARMMSIFWDRKNEESGKDDFPAKWNSIEMKKIYFTYKKEERDKFHTGVSKINLEIKNGSKIGLSGKTGSGKSTLAKLLVGLYKIDRGEYLIGKKDFYKIKNDEILKNISIVLQESEMFNLSLRENITLMHKFDQKLFKQAIEIAQLKEVVKKLPKGVNTFIGEKGYHLSGGERQRVGIARAIYRNTQVMIFDEATSSLDSKTEALIQESLERKMEKKTLIFIAHRVTTLKNVDRIYVFKNGQIVEQGKYSELINDNNSEFHRLFKN